MCGERDLCAQYQLSVGFSKFTQSVKGNQAFKFPHQSSKAWSGCFSPCEKLQFLKGSFRVRESFSS